VAIVDSVVVGYVSGYRHTTFYANGPTAWVDELYVRAEFRGNGLGRALMADFEHWAWSNGCQLIGLATSGARDFYRQLGYESKAGYYKKYAASDA
jgi:GNAT superfamily N-acetyltransferase